MMITEMTGSSEEGD